jgi:hypothetical protein
MVSYPNVAVLPPQLKSLVRRLNMSSNSLRNRPSSVNGDHFWSAIHHHLLFSENLEQLSLDQIITIAKLATSPHADSRTENLTGAAAEFLRTPADALESMNSEIRLTSPPTTAAAHSAAPCARR